MKTFQLNTGAHIPSIGLGTWQSPDAELQSAIHHAVKTGYRHLDCSPIYGNEVAIGEALQSVFKQNLVSREDLWITSKLWNSFHKYQDVEPAVKKTLSDLQLDYLDLFLIHWPVAFAKSVGYAMPSVANDILTEDQAPLADTWSSMESLVEKGLVKNIGVSNFSIQKLQTLLQTSNIVPAVNQIECHPYLAQFELAAFCNQHNILLTAYSPLGNRNLPEGIKLAEHGEKPMLLDNKLVLDIAAKHQATPAQILLAWALARHIAVIPKSTNPGRLAENLNAHAVVLSEQDITALDALDSNIRYIHGKFWELPEGVFQAEAIWG